MSHPPSNFTKFIGTPFEHYILPIIPAGAKLSEESSLTADYLGKIPGTWSSRQKVWYGFPKWQSYWTTHFDLEKWQSWQKPDKCDTAIAIGLRLPFMVAIDVDVENEEKADRIEAICHLTLGTPLCIRRREGSARRVLIYLQNLRKMRIEKGRIAWEVDGEMLAVDVLGFGQQVVIEGPHAKGAMHYWFEGKGLADVTPDEIRKIIGDSRLCS